MPPMIVVDVIFMLTHSVGKNTETEKDGLSCDQQS